MFDETAEKRAQTNHDQTLERLNARGGLSHSEALAILCDMECDWQHKVDTYQANKILIKMVAMHNATRS